MSLRKIGGLGLVAGSFVGGVVGGALLAQQVQQGTLAGGQLFINAGVVFVPLLLVAAAGGYLYLQEGHPTVSPMHQQRMVVDILREKGRASLAELAHVLAVSPEQLRGLVKELAELGIISGYARWGVEGEVVFVPAPQMAALEACLVCGTTLVLGQRRQTTCPHCGTEHFQIVA